MDTLVVIVNIHIWTIQRITNLDALSSNPGLYSAGEAIKSWLILCWGGHQNPGLILCWGGPSNPGLILCWGGHQILAYTLLGGHQILAYTLLRRPSNPGLYSAGEAIKSWLILCWGGPSNPGLYSAREAIKSWLILC